MPRQSMNLLCSYRYDALDRLVACVPSAQASTRRFYLRERLATEIQGTVQCSIMQHDDQLLAQQQRQSGMAAKTSLLTTDQQRSALTLLDAKRPHAFAYTPYGHCLAESGLLSLLGFNGERPDPVTGWYLLGNGYRAYNPVLMRFNSPDSWSPFAQGGLNAYVYCIGDPRNRMDSTGHFSFFPTGYNPVKGLMNWLGYRTPSSRFTRTEGQPIKNPLARPNPAEVPTNSGSPYDISALEELPPSYKNLFPDTELREPGVEFRFEQALRRSNYDLEYLEILRHAPEQRPALNAIQSDIRTVSNIIKKLSKYHDDSTLPSYKSISTIRQSRPNSISGT